MGLGGVGLGKSVGLAGSFQLGGGSVGLEGVSGWWKSGAGREYGAGGCSAWGVVRRYGAC